MMGAKDAVTHVAILAPVPGVHLKSAPKGGPRVAFATTDWELFGKRLRELRTKAELPVHVFIYASGPDGSFDRTVSYTATYVELIEDKYTVRNLGYRPPSTESDTDDHCVFWVVENLHELPEEARIPVFDFRGYGKDKPYKKNFVPHRPLLIEHPHLTLL
jgi:hypothetical protein